MTTLDLTLASPQKDKFYTFHTSELPTPIREAVQALPHGTQVFLRTRDNDLIVGHTTRVRNKKAMDVYLETELERSGSSNLAVKSIRFETNGVECFATI